MTRQGAATIVALFNIVIRSNFGLTTRFYTGEFGLPLDEDTWVSHLTGKKRIEN